MTAGVCYETGTGMQQDIGQALAWYGAAAQRGHKVAGRNYEKLLARLSEMVEAAAGDQQQGGAVQPSQPPQLPQPAAPPPKAAWAE